MKRLTSIIFICLIVFLIAIPIVLVGAASNDYVISSTADCWSIYQPAAFYTDSQHLGKNGNSYTSGINFTVTGLNHGDTITNAYLSLNSDTDSSNTINLRIFGVADDNAASPANLGEANNLVDTMAYVDWSLGTWVTLNFYNSPDLTTIIQEIIDRAGWNTGNNLEFVIKDNGTAAYTERSGYCIGGDPGRRPKLHIEYSSGPTSTSTVTSTNTSTPTETPIGPTSTLTPTITETPGPSLTPTITNTPGDQYQITLSSGNQLTILRQISYGEIAITLSIVGLIVVILIYMIIRIPKLWI